MSAGTAELVGGWLVAERAEELIRDLEGSLRVLVSGDGAEGELHFAISRAIANAIRIDLLATLGRADEVEVERRMAAVFRTGLTLA